MSEIMSNDVDADVRVLLFSPEELLERQLGGFLNSHAFIRNRVGGLVIDEAHEFTI